MGNRNSGTDRSSVNEAELLSGRETEQGGEFTLDNYPLHSLPCKRCGKVIEVRSESQPDNNFNCNECAEYIRKGDLRYEDRNEESPPKQATPTENEKTNPNQIILGSESQLRLKLTYNESTECIIRKEDLMYEDHNEERPLEQATPTENGKTNPNQQFEKIENSNDNGHNYYRKFTHDLLNDNPGSTSVVGEIAFLCLNKRSCLALIENQTSYTISCFARAILGKQKHTHDHKIRPEKKKSYFFKKSNFSLKGCAGILILTVEISEASKVCFLVAFRNYTVQIREQSCNKVAILRINDSEIETDVPFFSKLMKNKEQCPSFDNCCYVSDACTFKATIAHKQPNIVIEYDNIEIKVSMTAYFQSQVFVTVSSKKEITGEH